MPRLSLTDRFTSGVKVATQTDHFDDRTPGLALRVTSAGRKTWTFIFTAPSSGKRARMTLGTYPSTSLSKARTLALEARGHVDDGVDPRDVAAGNGSATTVEFAVKSYLSKRVRPHLRSAEEVERRFNKNVLPTIGGIKLCELDKRNLTKVIDKIAHRGRQIEAARVFEDMRAFLRWSVARGELHQSPMDGMLKPAISPPRDRVLSDAEMGVLWNGLPTTLAGSLACQRIIKICLLTAQRVGEVAGMEIAELDLAEQVWTIPAHRTKNGHRHAVPLSQATTAIIKEALESAGRKARVVFPAKDGGAFSPAAVARTIGRAQRPTKTRLESRFELPHWTAHDLRRTAVSAMASLGVPPIVLGHIINHRSVTRAGVTLSVYSQYDYARERRQALERWAQRLAEIIGGAR